MYPSPPDVNNKFEMTKAAYIMDILVRSFFIFVAAFLIMSYTVRGLGLILLLSLLITAGINIIFEILWGKKYWRAFKSAPKRQRRTLRQVLSDLWHRIFSRDKTRGFVWTGIVILLMSLVVRLNVYYIIFACMVFTLAAISRFAPRVSRATIQGEYPSDEEPSKKNSEDPPQQ